jgi:MoaA/NifB/PqqE/SkfB family radical SAM enzyme
MKERQPVFLFEITQKCDFKCKPCYESILVAGDQEEMKLWEWLIIIESIAEQNGRLILSGGDPLLREDIYDIISYAKVHGVGVEIATCGLNMTDERIEQLKKNGVDSVILRLDGITRDENDEYRGVRSFDDALATLDEFREHGMTTSLVINSSVDPEKLDEAYAFSKKQDVPLFIATKPWRGAPSIIRSRTLEQLNETGEDPVQGTIIDPEGKIYQLREAGVHFSGAVQEKRYRIPSGETE